MNRAHVRWQTESINVMCVINEFCKIAGYKINIQKSVVFLYTNNELSEKERKQSVKFTSKRIKYLGINLAKEVKDLYSESHDIDEGIGI